MTLDDSWCKIMLRVYPAAVALLLFVSAAAATTRTTADELTQMLADESSTAPSWGRYETAPETDAPKPATQLATTAPSPSLFNDVTPSSFFASTSEPTPPVNLQQVAYGGNGGGEWTAGAGAYLLHPSFSSNTALVGVDLFANQVTDQSFGWGMQGAPFVWLGYTGNQGLGFRTQWFQLDGNSQTVSATSDATFDYATPYAGASGIVTTGPGETITTQAGLKITTVDAELTKLVMIRRGEFLFSGGGRYAYVSQSVSTQHFDGIGPLGTLTAGHNAALFGPTAAVKARFATARLPRLAWYGRGRGALLFGDGSSRADLNDITLPPFQFSSSCNLCIPMAEVELGADWSRSFGRGTLTLDAGFVAQTWLGVGNSSGATTALFATDTTNLGLYGLKFSVGFDY